MAATDPAYRNLIQFVPEQPGCSYEETVKAKRPSIISGQDAKSFYESVVGSSDLSSSNHNASSNKHSLPEAVKRVSRNKHKKRPINRRGIKRTKDGITGSDKPPSQNVSNEIKPEKAEITRDPFNATDFSKSSQEKTKNSATFSRHLTCSARKHFQFLKAAQMGDVAKVCELLDQGASLNYQDFYGWTALMCAAKEGHSRVVQCLLDCGADFQIVNNEGLSASCLASSAGYGDLAWIISSYTPSVSGASEDQEEDSCDRFYCLTCKDYFLESERDAHVTSTVHLFNSGRKHQHPAYLLPETNRGFQMLLRTGWQIDKGLGPEGKGMKYPVRTVLKRDREGLGNSSNVKKAKITHFSPGDKAAVSSVMSKPKRNISARKSAQYALRSKEKRQMRKEINFRLEFNDL